MGTGAEFRWWVLLLIVEAGTVLMVRTTQCEGRHLAALELKAFMLSMLSTFEITLLRPVSSAGMETSEFRKLRIVWQDDGIGPKLLEGRGEFLLRCSCEGPWLTCLPHSGDGRVPMG